MANYLETGRKLHHLVGLDILQTVYASDTVTDGQYATGFFQIGLRTNKKCEKIRNKSIKGIKLQAYLWCRSHDSLLQDG